MWSMSILRKRLLTQRRTDCCILSYPYRIALFVTEMEKAVGITLMGLSISMVAVNLSFIPFRLNVVSWWILISAVMEFLYFYHDRHGF